MSEVYIIDLSQDVTARPDPPTYSEATAPPPSYASIKGTLRKHIKKEGDCDLQTVCLIIWLTVVVILLMGIVLAMPISMVVMGSIHINDCPAEINIPKYLIVAGIMTILNFVYTGIKTLLFGTDEDDEDKCWDCYFGSILRVANFCYFIVVNVYVYTTRYSFSNDPSKNDYCDYTLYWFSFWIITSYYIVSGILACCFCCVAVGIYLFHDEEEE